MPPNFLSQALGWVPGTDTLHLCLSDSREPAHQCGQDTQALCEGEEGLECHVIFAVSGDTFFSSDPHLGSPPHPRPQFPGRAEHR